MDTRYHSTLHRFLQTNTQFKWSRRLRYHHEAIALLLQALNESDWHIEQLYFAAGTEDLAALLPKLSLEKKQERALIVVRHFVHTMLVYFENIDDRLHIYIFESLGDGLHGPMPRILRHLQYFPDATIYLSCAEVQANDKSFGCTDYTLQAAGFLAKQPPGGFFQQLNKNHLRLNTYLLTQDPCTDYLRAIPDMNEVNNEHLALLDTLVQKLEHKYRNCFELLFFRADTPMQKARVIARKLAGMDIPDQSLKPAHFCDIIVDTNDCSVTLQYDNQDFIFANLVLFYTSAFLPEAHEIDYNIIYDHPGGITAQVSIDTNRIVFHANSLDELSAGLTLSEANKSQLFQAHMRQLLAITVLEAQIQQAIKLACAPKVGCLA